MYLDEQYTMYQIAYHLVVKTQFEVLHINEKDEEIWLEKYENKKSTVIRLVHNGFDWKNHLKKDIALVFQKVKAMKRILIGKNIELHNVYVSSHTPVDDWEILKKPMQLNERNPVKMKVYYLSDDDVKEEKTRFFEAVGVPSTGTIQDSEDIMKEESVHSYKQFLAKAMHNKKKEIENVFSYGKAFFTYVLLVINIFMFFILETNGGSQSIESLIQYGAKYNPAIIDGEWWRIVSSMFLHIGLLHLVMNMLAVFYLGAMVERIYGSWRFLIIYFLAGIGGGLASFAFSTNVSAGASGALFGLFGALLFFGLNYKKIFFQTMGKGILVLIAINIVFGFLVPQVDNGAHLGGLVSGFVASAVFHLPNKKYFRKQFIALLVYTAMIYGLITFGIQNNINSQSYQLMKIEELLKQDRYEEVVQIATNALDKQGDAEAPILFQRSYAYIEMNQIDLAIKDLEQSIQLDAEMPEAHYNLALLYYNNGKTEKAEESIVKAYEMMPEEEDFVKLYEKITGESVN